VARRFVILDRDGTILVERTYLSDPAQVALLPGAASGLLRLHRLGLGLVVLTNQSGVGRGYFDLDRLAQIHERMEAVLSAEGIRLDGIYYCPHVPEDGCRCRKPLPGMLERAAADLEFDPARAFVIGDKQSDVDLGRHAGAVTILVRTGYGAEVESRGDVAADYVVDGLEDAAQVIERLL
jgi:D-glycero-D-manno-heptose 1,7-bisphosphate phosphatase